MKEKRQFDSWGTAPLSSLSLWPSLLHFMPVIGPSLFTPTQYEKQLPPSEIIHHSRTPTLFFCVCFFVPPNFLFCFVVTSLSTGLSVFISAPRYALLTVNHLTPTGRRNGGRLSRENALVTACANICEKSRIWRFKRIENEGFLESLDDLDKSTRQ